MRCVIGVKLQKLQAASHKMDMVAINVDIRDKSQQ